MRLVAGRLIHRSSAWSGAQTIVFATPELGSVTPGQFLLVFQRHTGSASLPVPLFPYMHDRTDGILQCLLVGSPSLAEQVLNSLPLDTPIQLLGPAGHGFSVEARTRRAVLVSWQAGMSSTLFLARTLVERGIEVTFIGADAATSLMPGSFLPPEVEYLPALSDSGQDHLMQALETLSLWADQLFLAPGNANLEPVTSLLRRRLLRMRRGFAQVLLPPEQLPCGVGACDLCMMATRDGYRRRCRDGLVVDLLSLL